MITTTYELYKEIKIPYSRISEFKILEHESNGFVDGKWHSNYTRENQIKYIKGLDTSGLNNIKYDVINSNNSEIKVLL